MKNKRRNLRNHASLKRQPTKRSSGPKFLNRTQQIHFDQLETRVLLTASPIDSQFLVSEVSSLDESAPVVAVIETTAAMVAAWTSYEQPGGDESGLGVYVQRLLSDGTPDGARILVNAGQTIGDQFAPDVGVDASGRFVVAWQGGDDDGFGVYSQRFAADGSTLGGPILVNTTSDSDQGSPTVAMDNAGNFIVAWQSDGQDGSDSGVYARRFDSDGNAIDVQEFRVNVTTIGNQASPAAAVARETGNFVITWEGEVEGEHESVEIFGSVFDSIGNSIRSEFQVNATAAKEQVNPDVAMDADGGFVVTWTTEGLPGSGSDVFAQRFDTAGNAVGGEFQVNTALLQGQLNSVVTMDGDGDFFIAWQSSHQDEFSWGIFGRAYKSDGVSLVVDQQVNSFAEQPQTLPAVACNTDGQAVAVWLGLDADHIPAIHAQRYQLPGASFTAVGDEIVVANYLGLEDTSAAVAVNQKRNFFVAWQSYGDDGDGLGIVGRRLNSVGDPLGNAFVINTGRAGNQNNPAVAMDSIGSSVVVWQSADQDGDGQGIFAQRFNKTGTPIGGEFRVNSSNIGDQTNPSVDMNWSTGEFVVVWQGPDVDGEGIFGQRFDASGAPVNLEFQVNAETNLDQVSPEVSMNESGQFAVAWVSDHRAFFDLENDSEKSIFVQWYDSDGSSDGDEQVVHTIVKEYQAQEYPDIALDGFGNMTVVWQSITQDGSAWGVFGRQLLANKTPVQPEEFQINQTTAENQRRATVAADSLGNFSVSWQSDLQDSSATAIVSRQYNADGTPETDESIVNTWTQGPQILPIVAMTQAGDFGIFWKGQGTSRSEGVHGRIYEEGFVPRPPHVTVTPVGDQFLVSETTGIEQSFPAVAVVELSGNYVAAWTSFEQDGGDESGLGVYAQLFEADGTPLSDAFLVNSEFGVDDQSHPAVAVDANGKFVVVWESRLQDGSGYGIFARRYAADGTPDGSEFQVNTFTEGDQLSPTIAMDNGGNFVIAWQSQDGDGTGIFARRYDSTGAALEMEEWLVNSTQGGNQVAPTAARAREDGRYVIGWQSEVIGGEGEIDVNVLAHLYGADGSTLLDEFIVNTITEKDQVGPFAAMGPGGDFVVAWTSEGQVGSGADVYARRFEASGVGLGDDFRVNATTAQGQQYPAVGIDANGDFIVSWQSSHQDGFSWGIFGKIYDSIGQVLLDEFQVNTNVQGPQTNPTLNANSQGTAVVAWLGLDATHAPAIHAQRYQLPQGIADVEVGAEGEVILNNYVALEEAPASVAVDAEGNYVVAWQSYNQDGSGLGIFAQRFDVSGIPLGDAFLVNATTAGNQSHPSVASDSIGNFIIVWQAIDQDGDGYGLFARRYGSDGNPVSGEFRVNSTIAGDQERPVAAMNPSDGAAIIVWQAPDVDGKGIFGQRYDASGATIAGETQINHFTDLDQVSPTVDMNASGEFIVGWVSDHRAVFDPTDTEKSIFVRWYDANGGSIGNEVLVHDLYPEFEAQEHSDVAIDENGNFVVVWQSINQDGNTWGVFGRQFLRDGSAVQDSEFQVNQTVLAPQRHASVVSDAAGNFIVAWQSHMQDTSATGVYARAYDSCGVPQTDEFLIPTWDQGPQTWPVMAISPEGVLGVFWTGHGTDRAEGVHGRIFEVQVSPVPAWIVNGTVGDDEFRVDVTSNGFVLTVNGVLRALDPCQAASLIIHGLQGNDRIIVVGSPADETAILNQFSATVSNADLILRADSVETIALFGGGGYDRAFMYDSAGNDTFLGRPTNSVLRGADFYNRVNGFDRVVGNAIAGDAGSLGDQAYVYDSTGNDTFLGRPSFSAMSGVGFFNRVNGFDRAIGNATAGTVGGLGDQAYLYDSTGDELFLGRPTFSVMSGVEFYNRVNGFDRVVATATDGGAADRASMFDSIGDDLFYGRDDYGRLSGIGFLNLATGFDFVFADATAGGFDTLDVDNVSYIFTHNGWEWIMNS